MAEELAAVMVPSARKAGFRPASFSTETLPGCSSSLTSMSPLRDGTLTGAISARKSPAAMAACARVRLSPA